MKDLIFLTLIMFSTFAKAYVVPTFRDLKPATQQMVEKQDFGLLAASSTAYVKAADYAGPTSAATVTLSSFNAQPDVPRNLVLTPGTSAGDLAACTVVINGTNYFGKAISENFVFAGGALTAATGAKAFKSVTSVVFPANCETGGFATTWSLGIGANIGLKNCIATDGDWMQSSVGGTYESTRATMAASATSVESNTATFNGTMNGSNRFLGYFMQNFACLP